MKTRRLLPSLFFFFVLTQLSFAQIEGSKHDFSASLNSAGGQLCVTCHVPHGGNLNAPLWGRYDGQTTTFDIYASATLDATDVGQPDASAKLCLSCHDGVTGLSRFMGASGTQSATDHMTSLGYTGISNLGSDLRNDHPISFEYTTALATADAYLEDPATALSDLGGTIQNDLLFNNKMQCATCHDIHAPDNNGSLLRKSMSLSGLCTTCHIK